MDITDAASLVAPPLTTINNSFQQQQQQQQLPETVDPFTAFRQWKGAANCVDNPNVGKSKGAKDASPNNAKSGNG